MHESAIRHFFGYFRKRVDVIETMTSADVESLSPDQCVLIGTVIEALSSYWAKAYESALTAPGARAGRRWQRFLCTFGDAAIFDRVCGPDLRRRAHEKNMSALVEAARKACKDDDLDDLVRTWRDEPSVSELLVHNEIVASGASEEFLRKSTYGEVLYREFRCAWAHELREGDLSTRAFSSDKRYDEPHYENWIERGPFETTRIPVFPRVFLLGTLRRIIDGFEARCVTDDRSPVS